MPTTTGTPRPLRPWLRNLLQSLLVAGFILLAFFAVYRFHSKLAMASLAASAFIAFGFPLAQSARVRFLVGGYACGVVCGGLCCFLLRLLLGPAPSAPMIIVFSALAVFLCAFSMFSLGLQHPPAAAMAISMVLEPNPLWMGLTMMGCVLVLCGMRWLVLKLLGPRLPGD